MNKLVLLLVVLSIHLAFAQEENRFNTITNLDVNSDYADFGVKFYKSDMVLFASSRKDNSENKRERSRNRMQQLEFYKGLIGDDGEIIFAGRYSLEKFNMFYESDITFSADGKTIFFTLNNYVDDEYTRQFKSSTSKKHILNIFKATIDDAGIASNIESLPINNTEYSVSNPNLSPDGKTLYYISDSEEGYGNTDIYKIAVNADGSYGVPQNLGPNVNSAGREMFPFMSTNNILYFASDGRGGMGFLDNFSSLASAGDFEEAKNLGSPMNSPYDDFAIIVSPEKGLGYFSSSREGTAGADIFSFKLEEIDCNQLIAGVLKNENTNEPIADATVQLYTNDTQVSSVTTDEFGVYAFTVDCESSYTIKASYDGFSESERAITTSNIGNFQQDVPLFIHPLECNQFIAGRVISKETLIPLLNIEIALYHKNTLIERTYSEIGGLYSFSAALDCNTTYEIKAESKNYLPLFKDVKTEAEPGKQLDISLELDEFQDFITVRNIKMIKTDPIHFDLNDAAIRSDAATELDKVVEVMQRYPEIKIEIKSHTDSRAPDAYNMRLSEDRAKSTIAYVISKGISPSRIYGKGYGETELVNECANGVKCSESKHQENRRTEFIVINE